MASVWLVFISPEPVWAAASAGVVAVPLGSGIEREAATIFYALESVVRQSHRASHVNMARVAEGGAVSERDDAYERAKAMFARGMEAYTNLEFTTAVHAFEDSLKLFEQSDLTISFPDMLDAYAMKAASSYFFGNLEEARSTIRRLLSLRSSFVFDGRLFPPDIREVAEVIRAEIDSDSRNALEVTVGDVNARVYVNGVFRGISPIEVRDLPPAYHYVTVVALGRAMVQERHRSGPGSLLRVAMPPAAEHTKLAELLRELERGLEQGSVSRQGATIARWASLDEVLVAGVDRAGAARVRVIMARVASDGHVLATGEHLLALSETTALTDLATAAARMYEDDLPRGPGGSAVARELRVRPLLDKTTAGYIAGGVAATSAVGGVLMGLHAQKRAQAAKEIPQRRQEEIADAVAGARRAALIADVFYGAAFVGGVVGFYLVMPSRSAHVPEPSRGIREEWFAVAPAPTGRGAMITVGGQFE